MGNQIAGSTLDKWQFPLRPLKQGEPLLELPFFIPSAPHTSGANGRMMKRMMLVYEAEIIARVPFFHAISFAKVIQG